LTTVMASHDMNIASEFCDQLIMLWDGKMDRMGHPEEVITRENIQRVYGCDVSVDRHPVSGAPRIHLLKK